MFRPASVVWIAALLVSTTLSQWATAGFYGTHLTSDQLTGTRSVDQNHFGVIERNTGGGSNKFPSNGTVQWDIAWDGNAWQYEYTFSNWTQSLSHVTFDISNGFANPGSYVVVGNAMSLGLAGSTQQLGVEYHEGVAPNDELTGTVKVNLPDEDNTSGFTVSFESLHMPMWGGLAIKTGRYTALNTGRDGDSGTSIFDYVAVPDTLQGPPNEGPEGGPLGGPLVPEPASFACWISIAGLFGLRRRRRRHSA